jgi:L-aminopeptidase/D-esterase-like protein
MANHARTCLFLVVMAVPVFAQQAGSSGANGSGDYGIAFSTARNPAKLISNDDMSPLFVAVIEATEEAIYNSLLRAVTITGNGHTITCQQSAPRC